MSTHRTGFSSLLFLSVIVGFIHTGCDAFEGENTTPARESAITQAEIQRIEEVGKLHNKSVEFVRRRLSKTSKTARRRTLKSDIRAACMDFAKTQTFIQTSTSARKDYLRQHCSTGMRPMINTVMGEKTEGIKGVHTSLKDSLSDKQIHHLKRVFQILEGKDQTPAKLRENLSQAESVAVDALGRKAVVVLLASSVGKHSAEYWSDRVHIQSWARIVARYKGENLSDIPFSKLSDEEKQAFKKIRSADAGGAVGGAVTAAVTGFGEATFGAGIAMGALTGSVGASTAKAAEIGYEEWVE